MKRFFLVSLIAVSLAQCADARLSLRDYPWQKSLIRPDGLQAEVASFALDNEMYAATDDRYANIRIADVNEAETPYCLRKKVYAVTQIVERATASEIVSFDRQENNIVNVVLKKEDAKVRPEALVIHTRDRNFEKPVRIFGSSDGASWELLTEAKIFDYSRYIDVRSLRVELPPGDHAQYRIEIGNFTEQVPDSMTGISTERRGDAVFSEIEHRALQAEAIRIESVELRIKDRVIRPDSAHVKVYESRELQKSSDDEKQTTSWTFGTDRQPLTSLSFESASRNFSRPFTVEGRRGKEEDAWHTLGSATLHQFELGGIRDANLTVTLNGDCRYDEYRVTVFNRDNASLDISGVVATGYVYEVLFLPDPSADYTVLYGGNDIPMPRYDVETVLSRVPTIDSTVLTLGKQEANPKYKPGPRWDGKMSKILFTAAVIGMVILLGWFIAKGAGKIEAMEE
ncbi:MAG: DUF3999 family protein [Kiritimatiellia bacterium]